MGGQQSRMDQIGGLLLTWHWHTEWNLPLGRMHRDCLEVVLVADSIGLGHFMVEKALIT